MSPPEWGPPLPRGSPSSLLALAIIPPLSLCVCLWSTCLIRCQGPFVWHLVAGSGWWRGGPCASAERVSGWGEQTRTPPSQSPRPALSLFCPTLSRARGHHASSRAAQHSGACGVAPVASARTEPQARPLPLSAFISRLFGFCELLPLGWAGLGWLHEAGSCRPCCVFSAWAVPPVSLRGQSRFVVEAVPTRKLRSRFWG